MVPSACISKTGSSMSFAYTKKMRWTVFGLPETTFGLMPGCGGTVRLAAITGKAKAMELILTGRNFSAEEALSWGIVHQVVPRKLVVEVAVELARGFAGGR